MSRGRHKQRVLIDKWDKSQKGAIELDLNPYVCLAKLFKDAVEFFQGIRSIEDAQEIFWFTAY